MTSADLVCRQRAASFGGTQVVRLTIAVVPTSETIASAGNPDRKPAALANPRHMTSLRMQSFKRFLGLMTMMMVACASEPMDGVDKLLLADGAYGVQRRALAGKDVEQLTYTIRLPFPRQAVDRASELALKEQGWKECAPSTEWEVFVDSANQPARLVHQSQRVFAKTDRLVAAGMFYNSPVNHEPRSRPAHDEQHVVVMKYNLENPAVKEQMVTVYPQCTR